MPATNSQSATPTPDSKPVPAPSAPSTLQPKKNIFTSPLRGVPKKGAAKREELKKANYKNAYIRIFIAALFVGVYSYMFFYPQLQSYLEFDNALAKKHEQMETLDVQIEGLIEEREEVKRMYEDESKEEVEIISSVFPEEVDKLGIIRLLEDYAAYLSATSGDFEFTSISFQDPEVVGGYTVLPFQTSIHSSKENFDHFLGLVNASGSLDPKKEHIRLMEISNISLSYAGLDKEGKDGGVDFNVRMLAYSQPIQGLKK